jgi:hypothetical protein
VVTATRPGRLALAIEGSASAERAVRSHSSQGSDPVTNRFGPRFSPISRDSGCGGAGGEHGRSGEVVEQHRGGGGKHSRSPQVEGATSTWLVPTRPVPECRAPQRFRTGRPAPVRRTPRRPGQSGPSWWRGGPRPPPRRQQPLGEAGRARPRRAPRPARRPRPPARAPVVWSRRFT